jgi:hypothetical protein
MQRRDFNHAVSRKSVFQYRYERPEQREARYEAFCAVNGVNHPGDAVSNFSAFLFSYEVVRWIPRKDEFPQSSFNLAVCYCDGSPVGLHCDVKPGPEVFQSEGARFVAEQFKKPIDVHR